MMILALGMRVTVSGKRGRSEKVTVVLVEVGVEIVPAYGYWKGRNSSYTVKVSNRYSTN
jgi:hypothetical protein